MATLNQKIVTRRILEKVRKGQKVSVSKEMRGIYSDSIAKKPGKLTKSKGFQELFRESGMDAKVRTRKHAELIHSSYVEFQNFDAIKVKKKWIHITNEEIYKAIEGTTENPTGCKIVSIQEARDFKRVTYRAPNQVVQAKILEMQHKLLGDFAPDKLEFITDEMSDEERNLFDSIFNNNKK